MTLRYHIIAAGLLVASSAYAMEQETQKSTLETEKNNLKESQQISHQPQTQEEIIKKQEIDKSLETEETGKRKMSFSDTNQQMKEYIKEHFDGFNTQIANFLKTVQQQLPQVSTAPEKTTPKDETKKKSEGFFHSKLEKVVIKEILNDFKAADDEHKKAIVVKLQPIADWAKIEGNAPHVHTLKEKAMAAYGLFSKVAFPVLFVAFMFARLHAK